MACRIQAETPARVSRESTRTKGETKMLEEYEHNNFDNYAFISTEFISCVDCAEVAIRTEDRSYAAFCTGQASIFLQIINAKGWGDKLKKEHPVHLKAHTYYESLIRRY